MPKAVMGEGGSIRLPEEILRRNHSTPGTEWWLSQRDSALILLPRLPDLRKIYVEPTTVCNLKCRTCIRNVWEDPKTHMEMETFRLLMEQVKSLPELRRVVFSGLGEPLTHPHFLDMIHLRKRRLTCV